MKKGYFLIILVLLNIYTGCKPSLPEKVADAYERLPKTIDYNTHVKPILSDKCFACHGPDKAKISAGLQLHSEEAAFLELPESPSKFAIDPGNLKKSEVFHRILSEDPTLVMPTPESYLKLSPEEKAILIRWIEEGAEYKDHWAFITPSKPEIENKTSEKNPIDHFVIKKLSENNLNLSKKASKELLLRRVSLDLTGLPPTKEELFDFLNDSSPNAYEKQVDRLLASEHYGEKMAIDWLDLARYADTHGYFVDRYRDMSPWRDWVINSFNENIPYDQFITWQLAGDLLENPTKDQILATGFNRLHPQNLEGGIIDEEFRIEYVSDRTNVVGQGIMGLTVTCAKCHDHKYDPISQKNYFELFSFFNQVNESGQIPWDWSMPVPTMLLPTQEEEQMMAYINDLVKNSQNKIKEVVYSEKEEADQWIANEKYQGDSFTDSKHLVAYYDFENSPLRNNLNYRDKTEMKTQFVGNQKIVLKKGYKGKGLQFDGDAWLDLDKVGVFQRSENFSIGIRVFIPKDLKEGVIFHKAQGTRLHSYRGYHLSITKDNTFELLLAHVWPDNAIVEKTIKEVPRDQWIQLTITYDGSSKASGLKLYMNGEHMQTNIEIDNLYKDIIFHDLEDYIYPEPIEPGLQIGARWRGKGIAGAIVDDLKVFTKELTPLEVLKLSDTKLLKPLISKTSKELSDTDKKLLTDYYLSAKSIPTREAISSLQEVRTMQADNADNIKEIMVMKDSPGIRKTYLLERGQYDAHGEEVFSNTPNSLPAMSEDLPKNRLGLAKWLTDSKHPLTARVAVNRYWQNFFGKGIVETSEDFGNQGSLPTHPELLDWLATSFIESGWDLKALNKQIVMSQTYQQDSNVSEELREMDPDNSLLARGPSKRLSGEMLRDNALVASGLLNAKIGGESVKPYQPKGLWKMTHLPYKRDAGDKLYRRSLYTIWKRTAPNPTIATFDASTREICMTRRQETNTPLQALVLLNDPTYIEASKVMGKNMTAFDSIEEGIKDIYIRLTGRQISQKELQLLVTLQQEEYDRFNSDILKAKGWLASGDFAFDRDDNLSMIAANAVVASTIMNSDATITKR
ncbi:DUF1553 domain-containing protein [Aquimarina sp. AD1]|uniref:DUF1553 domain-containing protein n=1 Tax=Aquimarina sp. (strain AD1) TaxID=1714848 RepID=UPI000E51FCD2|nr:DUF1553 domain-containing protein [Aquimarina sp. AD1]AXT56760.1 DUF1553 domain-containing protein [Aquimarina sp. AD1]RKN34373.1 DUF1553 domain-containing protein [Aquimarina sp. AD1]